MGTQNIELQNWLLQQKPGLTKEAVNSAIVALEDEFIKAAQAGGMSAADLLKTAQEQPDVWNNLVNRYVSEQVVSYQQAKMAEEQTKLAEQEKMAAAAEAVHLGQVMAHSFLEELHKIGEAAEGGNGIPPALAEAMKDEDKKDDDKKDDDKKDDKKDDDKKEASRLPLPVQVNKLAIEKKASAGVPTTPAELEFLALCKLAESGYNVDFSSVK